MTRRWQAVLIVSVFLVTVAGAAVAGWWYARESAPHTGPIVLITVNGLSADALTIPDPAGDSPAPFATLVSDAIVFERAYSHVPLTLPAHASLLSGQLPFEHGVRDNVGFSLNDNVRSLPELLRNRGFETGAAVSSLLLRPESGLAQGFTFFDGDPADTAATAAPGVEREAGDTVDAAATWIESRRGNRYFLFVQVDGGREAEPAVGRLVDALKERGVYDQATIVLTSDRGATGSEFTLDEASLRVPLLVKQPNSDGAGRHVGAFVQHIDLLPTILDLVRAPMPDEVRGQSLRGVLDGDDEATEGTAYAESLAALFRFGGTGSLAVSDGRHRLVRAASETLETLEAGAAPEPDAAPADRLRSELDQLLVGHAPVAATRMADRDEALFAALGYLGDAPIMIPPAALSAEEEASVGEAHRAAAVLVSQKRYTAAIEALRTILKQHGDLAVVRYQLGVVLSRSGRLAEAVAAFREAASADPDNPYVHRAIAEVLLRAGRTDEAGAHAALAVAIAEHKDAWALGAAHGMAAIVALSRGEADEARAHAMAAQQADPTIPMVSIVAGRLAHAEGEYEEALVAFEAATRALAEHMQSLEGVHWYTGDTLARLERLPDAEAQYREELREFPNSIPARSSLATLFHAAGRQQEAEEMIEAILEAVPTPEGYDAAARLSAELGGPARAAALRADARSRFRGDPSLAFFQSRR